MFLDQKNTFWRLLNNELQKWYCAASQILDWKIWNIIQIVYEVRKLKEINKKVWWRTPLDIWHVFLVILICAIIIIISWFYGTIICCLLCSPLLVLALWKGQKTRGGRTCPLPPYSYIHTSQTQFPTIFCHAQNPFLLHHTWLCQILNVQWSIGQCQFISIKIQNSNQNNLRRIFCRPHITILVSKYVLAVSSLKNKSTLSLFGNSLWEKYCAEEDPVWSRKVLDNAITNSQDIIKSVGSLPLEPQESQLLSIFLQKF